MSTAEVQSLQSRGWAGFARLNPAPIRPAPAGLAFDTTTESDALQWTKARSISCKAIRHGYRYLRCRGFSAAALGLAGPPVSEMWLSFGPDDRLIGVDIYTRGMSAEQVSDVWDHSTAALNRLLGAPPIAFGNASPAALRAQAGETARVQYRYSNYLVTITASNMPKIGLAVRLQYLSPGAAVRDNAAAAT
ncbi:hypothetical protein [Trinickia dinghuensis]|uniref:hypothetical protein n=1 Tax=Trinickia dinghuensis TaxID=2291023 RepID=UPI001FE505DF|nr:hypothetical protein [Trinickia dinghuensis]